MRNESTRSRTKPSRKRASSGEQGGEGDAHAGADLRGASRRRLPAVRHLGRGPEQALADRELEQHGCSDLQRRVEGDVGAPHRQIPDLGVARRALVAQRDRQTDRHAQPAPRLECVAAREGRSYDEAQLGRFVGLPQHPADAALAERPDVRPLARRTHDQHRVASEREPRPDARERRIEARERKRSGHDQGCHALAVLAGEQERLVHVGRVERVDALADERERGRPERGSGGVEHERAAVVALHARRIGRRGRRLYPGVSTTLPKCSLAWTRRWASPALREEAGRGRRPGGSGPPRGRPRSGVGRRRRGAPSPRAGGYATWSRSGRAGVRGPHRGSAPPRHPPSGRSAPAARRAPARPGCPRGRTPRSSRAPRPRRRRSSRPGRRRGTSPSGSSPRRRRRARGNARTSRRSRRSRSALPPRACRAGSRRCRCRSRRRARAGCRRSGSAPSSKTFRNTVR